MATERTGRSAHTVFTIWRTELRMLLRDRRTVVISIVLPLLLTPLLIFGARWVQERRERTIEASEARYAVVGTAREWARGLILRLQEGSPDSGGPRLPLIEVSPPDPASALARGDLDVYVVADSSEAPLAEGATHQVEDHLVPTLSLHYRQDRDTSARAARLLAAGLRNLRRKARLQLLASRGITADDYGRIVSHDLASAREAAGLQVGRYVVLFVMLFMLSGGSVVAVDTLAGEKERGTLETLLTTGASRADLIAAKHLVILSVAVLITIIQSLNFLAYLGLELIPLPRGMALAVPPVVALVVFVMLVPLAALVSAVLLLTSGYARSYKEAQLYFFPVTLLGLLPALAPLFPTLTLRSAVVAVPIANLALAIKEILAGRFDWPFVLASWLVTAAAAVAVRSLAERTLSTERLIVPSLGEGAASPERLFARRVLPAFAIMWSVFLLLALRTEGRLDLRVQLLMNLSLFLGGSLALIKAHRLSVREVFALRAPRRGVWPLVLLGAPAGLLASTAVFRLSSHVLPVPPEMVEAFGKALLPEGIPLWQLLLFVAVLPGIVEELTFRGTLLYGLRSSLTPVPLALVVGALFGLFHVALFRLIPTAFLGVLLSGVTLLSGSILPAMAWHALNNGIAVVFGWVKLDVGSLPPLYYVAGVGVLACVFAGLWHLRTPYPGLKKPPTSSRMAVEDRVARGGGLAP